MRKTKIICTLGPAVEDVNTLKELMLNGMDCARLNFSHGDYLEHLGRIEKVKALRKELNLPIPILLDTKGPEIRVGNFENSFVDIVKGQRFIFSSDSNFIGCADKCGISYSDLYKSITKGTKILVDDGKVGFEVEEIKGTDIITRATNSGRISNKKSINVPNIHVDMPYMSKKDCEDILFGIQQDVDFIAASFVRTENDVLELKNFLEDHGGKNIKIISKIENMQGILNLDAIIKQSDGVMVARGDMGVEVPFEELPVIQKDIIKKCYRAGKHVITATQMLESMTKSPRPTRAEVSDVANAIYDGTTVIMLSGETAMGDYPIESVKAMAAIAETTEENINYKKRFEQNHLDLGLAVMSAVANAACISANQLNAKAIVAVTNKGVTAQSIANYRPQGPIIAATPNEKVARQLNLCWNVKPIMIEWEDATDENFENAVRAAYAAGLVCNEDMVVIAGGVKKSNLQTGIIKIHKV